MTICPICGAAVSPSSIDEHVNACLDGGGGGAVDADDEADDANDAEVVAIVSAGSKRTFVDVSASPTGDELLAQALQAEEDRANKKAATATCGACDEPIAIDQMFILDDCSHKLHRRCAAQHVQATIATSLVVLCSTAGCGKQMSVRDLKELVGDSAKQAKQVRKGVRHDATQRLMSELELIAKSEPEKSGYSVDVIDDDLYAWEIKFFGFDDSEPLAADLKKVPDRCVVLHATFPRDFPFAPPFIRVIRPRFQYRSGHVTVGGSICFELLTKSGWSAFNTLEAVIVSIRTNMLVGGARVEKGRMPDYSEREAREAFDRMVQQHGW